MLTHWVQNEWFGIGLGDGLAPGRCQAITLMEVDACICTKAFLRVYVLTH